MGWLNTEKPPEKWSNSYFKLFVEKVRTAINYLDSENFPDGVDGLWLKNRSVPLKTKVTGYGGIPINYDFFANHTALSVTSTTLLGLGSAVLWSSQWAGLAKLYLEVTGYVANATYPATVEVHGTSGAIVSKQITATTITRNEWEITALPSTDMTFVFKTLVNNATYPLTILSARIILKLTEST
jgi:hypothetical protein